MARRTSETLRTLLDKWTVVLHRSAELNAFHNDDEFDELETDIYVAIGVEAPTVIDAVKIAKDEAFFADRRDVGDKAAFDKQFGPHDYQLLVVFAGRQDPVLWGWQPH